MPCLTGLDFFVFGLSTGPWRECNVRLQRRQLVEHNHEIAGAGDILLDNVVVSFESFWHMLMPDPLRNVVFIEWNRSGLQFIKLGITFNYSFLLHNIVCLISICPLLYFCVRRL